MPSSPSNRILIRPPTTTIKTGTSVDKKRNTIIGYQKGLSTQRGKSTFRHFIFRHIKAASMKIPCKIGEATKTFQERVPSFHFPHKWLRTPYKNTWLQGSKKEVKVLEWMRKGNWLIWRKGIFDIRREGKVIWSGIHLAFWKWL